MASAIRPLEPTQLSDEEVVQLVLGGDRDAFEILMRRNNQRLYRAARAILRDESEAEDVVQEVYVKAYKNLRQFAGRASFSTWLTRIAVHEALHRARRGRNKEEIDAMEEYQRDSVVQLSTGAETPETKAATAEVRELLERSIDALPDSYREVFVLRQVEEMSTTDTAACLGITEENVKTRLHRARAMLRKELYARAGTNVASAFPFMGARCDRIVKLVMARIAQLPLALMPAN